MDSLSFSTRPRAHSDAASVTESRAGLPYTNVPSPGKSDDSLAFQCHRAPPVSDVTRPSKPTIQLKNDILLQLTQGDRDALLAEAECIRMPAGGTLARPGDEITSIYFRMPVSSPSSAKWQLAIKWPWRSWDEKAFSGWARSSACRAMCSGSWRWWNPMGFASALIDSATYSSGPIFFVARLYVLSAAASWSSQRLPRVIGCIHIGKRSGLMAQACECYLVQAGFSSR